MRGSSGVAMRGLRSEVLRSVSRSFYLSIRLLPEKLRGPIALAYLLARATDTIADTAEIAANVRMEELARLARLIQGTAGTDAQTSFASFIALQRNAAERQLIAELPRCLPWLDALPGEDRADLREVLAKINEGQILDVQRFVNPTQISALATATELDQYTYLVAGCVGEFWTNVCSRHLVPFSERPREEMLSLGVEYGKGLQLINILRDLGADLRAGRCYLPADEMWSLGIDPADVLAHAQRVEPLLRKWVQQAEEGIAAGLEYSCAIKSWRVRLATVLPALIGARTLALLRIAGPRSFTEKIKISRPEVRRIIWQSVRTLAAPPSLRALFSRLSS
jgi:farnesyl-diphosphate farnesyltransferase